MWNTIISQPNLKILRRHGTEGPRHDPYSYVETTIERDGIVITTHVGLDLWVSVDGERLPFRDTGAKLNAVVLVATGYSIGDWERFIEKLDEARMRRHRGHDVRDACGFPGESLVVCYTCDRVIDSHFNEGAVI